MNEKPTVNCSLVDITCDSDGKLDQFISEHGISNIVPLHNLQPNEDYYVGLFLYLSVSWSQQQFGPQMNGNKRK